MNLSPGAVLAYSVEEAAWYWPAVCRVEPTPPDMIISAWYPGEGCEWTFRVVQAADGRGRAALILNGWENERLARAQAPELFEAMERHGASTLEDVWGILHHLGATDITMRERGY